MPPSEEYMTDENWKHIEGFSKTENWGNPYKIKKKLIYKLMHFRRYFRTLDPDACFHVNCAFDSSGHAQDSQHYRGAAIDGYIYNSKTNKPWPILDQYLAAERFNFGGIGLYPHWNPKPGGMHLDVRDKYENDIYSRWIRDKHGTYHSLNAKSFKREVIK